MHYLIITFRTRAISRVFIVIHAVYKITKAVMMVEERRQWKRLNHKKEVSAKIMTSNWNLPKVLHIVQILSWFSNIGEHIQTYK